MSYVGNVPTTAAFPFDQFSGNGSTTAFTLSYAPAGATSIIVSISGVVQNPNTYSVSGTTLTFTPAPPTGTSNIAVLYLGLPVVATLTPGNTAYFSSSVFTATASQTVFTPSGTYQVGFINVIRNGSQLAPADYTATNGTTVTLLNPCTAGDTVVIEVFNLTSISGALPVTGGTVTGATTFNSGVNLAVSSGNVGIGTSSPTNGKLVITGSSVTTAQGIRLTADTADARFICESATLGAGILGTFSNHSQLFYTNSFERARIDTSGNVGVNNSDPDQYATSGKVFNLTGTANNSGPANLYLSGSSTVLGRGFESTEVFAIANITAAAEITRITGTGANGYRAYFKIIVTGHTGAVDNGINIKEYYWDGATNAPVQISTYTAGTGTPVISFDNSTTQVCIVKLASSNGTNAFSGVMKVEWLIPLDFSSNTWTIS
jgi:hypothetical protein